MVRMLQAVSTKTEYPFDFWLGEQPNHSISYDVNVYMLIKNSWLYYFCFVYLGTGL